MTYREITELLGLDGLAFGLLSHPRPSAFLLLLFSYLLQVCAISIITLEMYQYCCLSMRSRSLSLLSILLPALAFNCSIAVHSSTFPDLLMG